MMSWPIIRPRRRRRSPTLRALVRETHLSASNFSAPLFMCHGHNMRIPITSMSGRSPLSIDLAVREVEALARAGISAMLLFGIPA